MSRGGETNPRLRQRGSVNDLAVACSTKLVMLNRKLQSVQGRLALCNLSPLIQESLEHTRLVPLFHIYATEAEAVQSFGAPS